MTNAVKILLRLGALLLVAACSVAKEPRTYRLFVPAMQQASPANYDISDQKYGAFWKGGVDMSIIVPGQWVKMDASWADVERVEGQYQWSPILDSNILKLRNHPIMLEYHNSPAWANSGRACELPDDNNKFIDFIIASIERYKPEAIEIWNEPASDGAWSASVNYCCGCITDPLDYTKLLNMVYARVKPLYPHITIVGGALAEWQTDWADKWFASEPKMDAVSFHFYTYYGITIPKSVDNLNAAIAQIKRKTNKPIWMSETSMLCQTRNHPICGEEFRKKQAEWAQALAWIDLPKIFWYTLSYENWEYCSLLSAKNEAQPAYQAFRELVLGKP